MHRFWLSWYAFILHTLMFFMACGGGHAFAYRPATAQPAAVTSVQDGSVPFIEEDHPHDEHADALLLEERDERAEEVEEHEPCDTISSFKLPPSELFWLSAFDSAYLVERQRGRAPPRHVTLTTTSHASLWFATARPSRGPPSV